MTMNTGLLRAKWVLFAGAAVLLSLATAPAHAQWYPSGSYARTCTNIQSYGGRVTAECRRMDGSWDRTWLYGAHRCAGGVANMDGRLTCNNGRHVGSSEYDRWEGYGDRRALIIPAISGTTIVGKGTAGRPVISCMAGIITGDKAAPGYAF